MQLVKTSVTVGLISLLSLNFVSGADSQESNRVAIVVNKYLKAEIEDNLNIYLQDLKNEGYEPILKEWDLENDPAPPALKAYLKGLYLEEGSLQGAVFIGDLPIPLLSAPITAGFGLNYIAERYYMDLIGKVWPEKYYNDDFEEVYYESNYKSDYELDWKALGTYTSEALKRIMEEENLDPIPEIWTSRITTSTLTDLFKQSEGKLVNKYLEDNHAYRTGQIVFQKQNLFYGPSREDIPISKKELEKLKNVMSTNYTLKEPTNLISKVYEFFEPLNEKSYDIFYWIRHGVPTDIDLGYEDLTSEILANTSVHVKTAFVFPSSCWIGYYIEPKYFAGSYIFNEQFFVLGLLTSTLPIYAGSESLMMPKFIEGDTLGQAFKRGTGIPDYDREEYYYVNYEIFKTTLNARYILGDGTLKLQHTSSPLNNHVFNKKINSNQYDNNKVYDYMKIKENHATEFDNIETINFLFEKALKNNDIKMLEILIGKGADLELLNISSKTNEEL